MSKQKQLGGRSRRSTLQAWGYYLLALMAWVTIVLVVSVLGFIICRSLIWYETNPLYHLLNWVRDYYFFVFAFVILVGWVVKTRYVTEEVESSGCRFRTKPLYHIMVRYVCPIFMVLILIVGVTGAFGIYTI